METKPSETKSDVTMITPEVAKALDESIAHWEGMASYTFQQFENMEFPHGTPIAEDCALCRIFLLPSRSLACDCIGCPIQRDGHPYCRGTPYTKASQYFDYVHLHNSLERERKAQFKEWQKYAADEIVYLKMLRRTLPVKE